MDKDKENQQPIEMTGVVLSRSKNSEVVHIRKCHISKFQSCACTQVSRIFQSWKVPPTFMPIRISLRPLMICRGDQNLYTQLYVLLTFIWKEKNNDLETDNSK